MADDQLDEAIRNSLRYVEAASAPYVDEELGRAIKLSLEEYNGYSIKFEDAGAICSNSDTNIDDNRKKSAGDFLDMPFILKHIESARKVVPENCDSDRAQVFKSYERDFTDDSKTSKTFDSKKSMISLSRNTLTDLLETLFGSPMTRTVSNDDIKGWCNQGFVVDKNSKIFWGLRQDYGGPCGVLASVQGFMLHSLIFHAPIYREVASLSGEKSPEEVLLMISQIFLNCITPGCSDFLIDFLHLSLLVEACCTVLYQATPESKYTIILIRTDSSQGIADPIHAILYSSHYSCHKFDEIRAVARHLLENVDVLTGSMGVISLVLSVLATRGIDQIKDDMDDPCQPLVGLYGHSTQELVNLMIHGRAVSNVFDCDKILGENVGEFSLKLKGISNRGNVGFLTELEALGYCKVGSFYKHPLSPIWVISSFSHYTVLFSLDKNVCEQSELEIIEQKAMRAWGQIDLEDNKFISKDSLFALLRLLGIENLLSDALDTIEMESGILLWQDFFNWYISKPPSNIKANSGGNRAENFTLFHYNGQDKQDPLTMVQVGRRSYCEGSETVNESPQDVDINIAGKTSGADGSITKSIWTRWPRSHVKTVTVKL